MLTLATTQAELGEFPESLEKWIAVEPPAVISEEWWAAANDIQHEWIVTLQDGHPRARLRDENAEKPDPLPFPIEQGTYREGLAGSRLSIKVSDGWLVAFNAGEFGGGLWWFSPNGTKRYKIAEAWVNGFFPTEAGILVPEGLAHGGASTGRILRLAPNEEGRWRSEIFADLGEAPVAAVKDADGTLVIATGDRLLRALPASGEVETLLDHAFWDGLYPDSMVVTRSETIYLGMRHGVARIEKRDGSYRVRWLLPNREFVETRIRGGFR